LIGLGGLGIDIDIGLVVLVVVDLGHWTLDTWTWKSDCYET
jgi:hypothetical protein